MGFLISSRKNLQQTKLEAQTIYITGFNSLRHEIKCVLDCWPVCWFTKKRIPKKCFMNHKNCLRTQITPEMINGTHMSCRVMHRNTFSNAFYDRDKALKVKDIFETSFIGSRSCITSGF